MTLLKVVVPAGLLPGDTMTIAFGPEEFTIEVPDGVYAGDEMTVDLPTTEDSPQEATATVTVVVPDGCYPGDEFTVEFEGLTFNIAVPDGFGPGLELDVEVPAAHAEPEPLSRKQQQQQQKRQQEKAGYKDPGYKFKPGQRVELLRSDGAFSPGTIIEGFEGVLDVHYKVQLDNGLFKEAVPEEELSEQCCEVGDLFDGL